MYVDPGDVEDALLSYQKKFQDPWPLPSEDAIALCEVLKNCLYGEVVENTMAVCCLEATLWSLLPDPRRSSPESSAEPQRSSVQTFFVGFSGKSNSSKMETLRELLPSDALGWQPEVLTQYMPQENEPYGYLRRAKIYFCHRNNSDYYRFSIAHILGSWRRQTSLVSKACDAMRKGGSPYLAGQDVDILIREALECRLTDNSATMHEIYQKLDKANLWSQELSDYLVDLTDTHQTTSPPSVFLKSDFPSGYEGNNRRTVHEQVVEAWQTISMGPLCAEPKVWATFKKLDVPRYVGQAAFWWNAGSSVANPYPVGNSRKRGTYMYPCHSCRSLAEFSMQNTLKDDPREVSLTEAEARLAAEVLKRRSGT